MRATEFLVELFNTIAPFKWTKSTPMQCTAKFTVDDSTYVVQFYANNKEATEWDLAFEARTRSTIPARGLRGPKNIIRQSYALTGTGNQYLVFATVMKLMEDFLKEYKPKLLKWNADKSEESRISLYGTMLNRFKKKLNAIGYDIAPASDANRDFADFTIIKL